MHGPAQAEHACRIKHGDDQDEVDGRCADDRQQHQREDQLRYSHEHIDQATKHLIDPSAQNTGKDAKRAAQ